jgi:hypothetical protein
MERVSGDSATIASSTNSCGAGFRCLMAKGVSSSGKEALSRRGFDMGIGHQNSTSELVRDWCLWVKPTYPPLNSQPRSQVVWRISRVAHSSHIRASTQPLG